MDSTPLSDLMLRKLYTILVLGSILLNGGFINAQNDISLWPELKKESKTWTRWWWMGSAVDKKNITQSLIAFEKAYKVLSLSMCVSLLPIPSEEPVTPEIF